MTPGDEVFRRLQATARSAAAKTGVRVPTQEYLIRHVLESFLGRLTRTRHAESFVLKGGVLLAAYGARRPTKDVDANAISADITAEHVTNVVRDIAAVETDDGLVFDTDTITADQIREQVDYPGLRVRVKVGASAVARYRGVTLEPVTPHLSGYGEVAQAKWAAWRRKEGLEPSTERSLESQITLIASYLDPVFSYGSA